MIMRHNPTRLFQARQRDVRALGRHARRVDVLHVDVCAGGIEVGDVAGLAVGGDGEGGAAVVREAGPVGFFDGVEFRSEVQDVGVGFEGDGWGG